MDELRVSYIVAGKCLQEYLFDADNIITTILAVPDSGFDIVHVRP